MLLRHELTLTYDGARLALDAAVRRAQALEVAVNVAVTDTGGGLLAFARMDGAFAGSGAIAQDKDIASTGAAAVVAGVTGVSPTFFCHRDVTERTHHDPVHAASS